MPSYRRAKLRRRASFLILRFDFHYIIYTKYNNINGDKMNKIIYIGLGLMMGILLSDMHCMKKPKQEIKKCLKKINIE